jgi:hypothetical protein
MVLMKENFKLYVIYYKQAFKKLAYLYTFWKYRPNSIDDDSPIANNNKTRYIFRTSWIVGFFKGSIFNKDFTRFPWSNDQVKEDITLLQF